MPTAPRILVDASSFLYRAFHALPDLRAPDGLPTGAILGVANMLRRLQREYPESEIVVVFDAPGKTFRDDLFDQYKAQRPPMPEDMRAQVELLHDWVRAMGLPLLVVPGVEADDVIGTLARTTPAQNPVIIVTGDKDLTQLVDDQVTLMDTMKGTRTDLAEVRARFGVEPKQIADYLALVGDKVDNIPGVPGAGPKTVAKWLQQYGDLDGILAHAQEIGGKVGESLRAVADTLPRSRELARIRCDVELPPSEAKPADPDALRRLAERLGFQQWLKDLPAAPESDTSAHGDDPVRRENYRAIVHRAELSQLLDRLQQVDRVAIDTETSSLDPHAAELVGFSLAWFEGETVRAVYVPLGHREGEQIPRQEALELLAPWLEDGTRAKLAQNAKFDWQIFWAHGLQPRGLRRDTLLESYVLDSTAAHDLDSLAERYLQHRNISYAELAGKGRQARSFADVDIASATAYAAEDAEVCLRVDAQMWPQIHAHAGLDRVFRDIEMPLVEVLARMEWAGVRIDVDALARLSEELRSRMAKTEAEAYAAAGQSFNLNSPKQIQTILFDKMQLPVLKKTPGGQPSTNEDVLAELAKQADLPRLVLDYRSLAKLKNTYVDALPQMIQARTGRVHTHYHQAVAATGRLSSSDPNLQNIPVRSDLGRRIRQAFVAAPGHLLISADYSQIELRIMAHLSGDTGLREAFAQGLDIHRATAAEVFAVPLEQVDADQRRAAKAINFGLIYGQTPYGLAQQLGVGQAEAKAYMERYFERYPGVREYMENTRRLAHRQGYVETLFGRRLYLPEIRSQNPARRNYAERAAINAPMQGTAADLIKLAMIAVDASLQAQEGQGRMLLQVHDELILEAPEKAVDAACAMLREKMEGVAQLAVPLTVGLGVGSNWDAAHGD
ncbi:MAG: DNA polymerase I [Acidithiobacillus sp.]